MSDHFFVVTGGPGAGKTSLITELARRGFHTTPESGRAIIREEMQSGGDALPWADRMAYAERMLARDLRAYSAAQALSGLVIFDRGIPDILGYLTLCGLPVPPHIAAAAKATVRPTRAAKILGINIRTIRSLMDTGVLKSREVEELKSGRIRRYVCAKSMERFSKVHISVVELATESGRLPGVEAVIQLNRGAKPLPLGLRANMIFRRSDVL